jgi:hypothetical protein
LKKAYLNQRMDEKVMERMMCVGGVRDSCQENRAVNLQFRSSNLRKFPTIRIEYLSALESSFLAARTWKMC